METHSSYYLEILKTRYYLQRDNSGYKTCIIDQNGNKIIDCLGVYPFAETMAERLVILLNANFGKSLLKESWENEKYL